ncbi:hypothetical protein WICMUC_004281 [Wickerhamomyces mucosus]|uniref:Uncharacterized protein n=1 Tax=Wickerhamomyces mucosus TaxID=1378264 RepID=A0A9P8PIU8_9ASCO|nr:hypothetical protein WICMUC_004281 [Wickerhamomyces mucosus]
MNKEMKKSGQNQSQNPCSLNKPDISCLSTKVEKTPQLSEQTGKIPHLPNEILEKIIDYHVLYLNGNPLIAPIYEIFHSGICNCFPDLRECLKQKITVYSIFSKPYNGTNRHYSIGDNDSEFRLLCSDLERSFQYSEEISNAGYYFLNNRQLKGAKLENNEVPNRTLYRIPNEELCFFVDWKTSLESTVTGAPNHIILNVFNTAYIVGRRPEDSTLLNIELCNLRETIIEIFESYFTKTSKTIYIKYTLPLLSLKSQLGFLFNNPLLAKDIRSATAEDLNEFPLRFKEYKGEDLSDDNLIDISTKNIFDNLIKLDIKFDDFNKELHINCFELLISSPGSSKKKFKNLKFPLEFSGHGIAKRDTYHFDLEKPNQHLEVLEKANEKLQGFDISFNLNRLSGLFKAKNGRKYTKHYGKLTRELIMEKFKNLKEELLSIFWEYEVEIIKYKASLPVTGIHPCVYIREELNDSSMGNIRLIQPYFTYSLRLIDTIKKKENQDYETDKQDTKLQTSGNYQLRFKLSRFEYDRNVEMIKVIEVFLQEIMKYKNNRDFLQNIRFKIYHNDEEMEDYSKWQQEYYREIEKGYPKLKDEVEFDELFEISSW